MAVVTEQDPGSREATVASRSFPKPTGWRGQSPGLGRESGDKTHLVLENRECYSALQAALCSWNQPGPLASPQGSSPFLLLTLHCDHSGSSISDLEPASPSPAPQPFLCLFQRPEAGQPAVCSQLHLLLSSDPSQPCPVLPMECLPRLPPECSLAIAAQTHQPGGPRGRHW